MKLDDLIDLAHEYQKKGGSALGGLLATGVLDLLSEAQPCGFEAPTVQANGSVGLPNEWAHTWVAADEGRAMARMLLRACDEADDANRDKMSTAPQGGEG